MVHISLNELESSNFKLFFMMFPGARGRQQLKNRIPFLEIYQQVFTTKQKHISGAEAFTDHSLPPWINILYHSITSTQTYRSFKLNYSLDYYPSQ